MSDVKVDIETEINEIFSKTKVTQIFENTSEKPIELQIFIYKNPNLIFNSFTAQIGDSIKVKSKVIKQEKAEEKYTDAISEGNAAIFVTSDKLKNSRLIIHMGNIPPKEKVIFDSEFISYIEHNNNKYEFELFRNLPIFNSGNSRSYKIYKNTSMKGKILFY